MSLRVVGLVVGRLAGIKSLLDLLDHALPESEWHENEALKKLAADQDWDFADFDVERQGLNERFRFWLPRFSAYSVLTLLHTVVETQLLACAHRVYSQRSASFEPGDIRGRGIDAAALYLKRVGAYDIRQDKAWEQICNLRDLRHLIVHRAGTKGQADEHRKTAHRLASAYAARLEFPKDDSSWYGEVWIAMPLCRQFIDSVEGFFDRVFDALDLPPRYERRTANSTG